MAEFEKQISDPDFWNQPEKNQKVMQDRKRLEEALASESQVAATTSDLDTLFELAREGENVTAELETEMKSFAYLRCAVKFLMLMIGWRLAVLTDLTRFCSYLLRSA